jgi:hypothetical protein
MGLLQNSNKTGAGYEQLVRSGENMKRSAQKTAKKVCQDAASALLPKQRKTQASVSAPGCGYAVIKKQTDRLCALLQGTRKFFGKKK